MGAQDDTEIEKANWHWRNSMRTVRFFNLDARAAIPFCILLFYFRPITLVLTFVITAIFRFLEGRGLTFWAALRALRVWIIGTKRPGWLHHSHRKMKDWG